MARRTRPTEERIAEIDEKIKNYHLTIERATAKIAELEQKKKDILEPKPRKRRTSIKTVIDAAKENGMTPEEIAEKLGIEL